MRTLIAATIVVLFLAVETWGGDDPPPAQSIETAVNRFNEETGHRAEVRSLPLLTEEEVVAAIRGWIPEHTPGVTTEIYDEFQRIAESGWLPEGARLSVIDGWRGYRGFVFEVWWIDLTISTGESTGYTFRIRDHKISSREMTPEEQAAAERRP
jgi:hypothetical protein